MSFSKLGSAVLISVVTLLSGTFFVAEGASASSDRMKGITSAPKANFVNRSITESEVLAAQRAWGDALVSISTTYKQQGRAAASELAGRIIDEAYGYKFGPVLFKPTLTVAPQTFRTTRAGALAYFVGGNPKFPADQGFALNSWRNVEIKNKAIFISGDTATTMGNVMLTDKNGRTTTVDKTWQFVKDDNGRLRIVLHHSSLPFAAK